MLLCFMNLQHCTCKHGWGGDILGNVWRICVLMFGIQELILVCLACYVQSGRIGAHEEIDDAKGKTMEEIEEMIEERELKAGTQILEMVCNRFCFQCII